jgi:futalosine hydrolase
VRRHAGEIAAFGPEAEELRARNAFDTAADDAGWVAAPNDPGVAFLVTGLGVPWTLDRLATVSDTFPPPRLALNIGIAGAYPDSGLAVGDIVIASGETYADIGYETPAETPDESKADPGFVSFAASELGAAFYGAPLPTVVTDAFYVPAPDGAAYRVRVARGATVNTCTGTDTTGRRRAAQTGAAFETMEGAAVAQWGRRRGVPVCEVRAISNIAGRRDMRPENIRRALDHLAHYLAACRKQQRKPFHDHRSAPGHFAVSQ